MPTDGDGHVADPITRAFGTAMREDQVSRVCPPRGSCLIIEMEQTTEGLSFDRYFCLHADKPAEIVATAAFLSALGDHLVGSIAAKYPELDVADAFEKFRVECVSKIHEGGGKYKLKGGDA